MKKTGFLLFTTTMLRLQDSCASSPSTMPSIERLQQLHDAYTMPPSCMTTYEQLPLDTYSLQEAIRHNDIPAGAAALATTTYYTADISARTQVAMQDQIRYMAALANNIPVMRMPTAMDQKLFVAIRSNEIAEAADALTKGASINALDTSSGFLYSPLQLAITLGPGYLEMAKFLAQHPAIKFSYLTSGTYAKTALDLAREYAATNVEYQNLVKIISTHPLHIEFSKAIANVDLPRIKRAMEYGVDTHLPNAPSSAEWEIAWLPQKGSYADWYQIFDLFNQGGGNSDIDRFFSVRSSFAANYENAMRGRPNPAGGVMVYGKWWVMPEHQSSGNPVAIAQRYVELLHKRDREILTAHYYAAIQNMLTEAKKYVIDKRDANLRDNTEHANQYELQRGLVENALAACVSGDLDAIERLRKLGDTPAWKVFRACKPLLRAIHHNNIHIVTYLIDNDVEYLDLFSDKEMNAYSARSALAMDMDYAKGGMLDHLVTHMQQANARHLKVEYNNASNSEYVWFFWAKYGKGLINRCQAMQWSELQGIADSALSTYESQHQNYYAQLREKIEAVYRQLADEWLHTLHKLPQEHGDKIAVNAQYYADKLQEFKVMVEQDLARARAAFEAQSRSKGKGSSWKIIKSFVSIAVVMWASPHLVMAFIQSGMSAMGATLLAGGASGVLDGIITGANPIKGAALGSITSGLSYTSQAMLKDINMPELLKVVAHSGINAVPTTIINHGNFMENIILNTAGEVISRLLPPSNLQNLKTETLFQELTRVLDDTVKITASGIPVFIVRDGDMDEKLYQLAMHAMQRNTGRYAQAHVNRQYSTPKPVCQRSKSATNARSDRAKDELKQKPQSTAKSESKSDMQKDGKFSKENTFEVLLSAVCGDDTAKQEMRLRFPYLAAESDSMAGRTLTPYKLATTIGKGAKDGFVEVGTFVGEEVARFHLREETKTAVVFKATGKFIGEEAARFSLGEQTIIEKGVRTAKTFLIEDAARWILGEQTKTAQAFERALEYVDKTPTEEMLLMVAKETTKGFIVGTAAKIPGIVGEAAEVGSSIVRSGSVLENQCQKPVTYLFDSKVTHNYEYGLKPVSGKALSPNVQRMRGIIEEYLGKDFKMIKNIDGDVIFIDRGHTRKIRFDVHDPHGYPHHGHVEIYDSISGKWKDAFDKHMIYLSGSSYHLKYVP